MQSVDTLRARLADAHRTAAALDAAANAAAQAAGGRIPHPPAVHLADAAALSAAARVVSLFALLLRAEGDAAEAAYARRYAADLFAAAARARRHAAPSAAERRRASALVAWHVEP